MFGPIALALLALPVQQARVQEPDREVVARTVERLDRAFEEGESAERIAALRQAANVIDTEVIERVQRGLKDRSDEVRSAALEALGFLRHEDALAALHGVYKRDRKLRKKDELYLRLLRAIGRHGDPASITHLVESPLVEEPMHVTARIRGLGNIRAKESVKALIGLMMSSARHRVQPYMYDLRLSLMVLTGVDKGKSQDAWMAWWNDHKRKLVVSPEPPRLPRAYQERWNAYWGIENRETRARERSRRGDD